MRLGQSLLGVGETQIRKHIARAWSDFDLTFDLSHIAPRNLSGLRLIFGRSDPRLSWTCERRLGISFGMREARIQRPRTELCIPPDRCHRDDPPRLQKLPGPSPLQGLALGCLPPNCATLSAVPMWSCTSSGKARKSSLLEPTQNKGLSPGARFSLAIELSQF